MKKIFTLEEKTLPQISIIDLLIAILFVPFSYFLIFLSVGITIYLGVFLIQLIYNLEASLIHSVHVGILLLIGLGVLIGIFSAIKGIFISFMKNKTYELAINIKGLNNEITTSIQEVCQKLSMKVPDNILLSFTPDFHVQQLNVITPNGKCKGRTLTIGLPYLRYLNKDELKAIIAHEMAHFTGKDTIFSIYVAPVYKSFCHILANLNFQPSKNGNNGNIAIIWFVNLPTIIILGFSLRLFAIINSKISRMREKRADFIASICYGNDNFKNALEKITKVSLLFNNRCYEDYVNVIKQEKFFNNYFSYFETAYMNNTEIEPILNKLIEYDKKTQLFDSHCSLKERLSYLPNIIIEENDNSSLLNVNKINTFEEQLSELYTKHIISMMHLVNAYQNSNKV
jgi:Zn-dependent protease with chaperone function